MLAGSVFPVYAQLNVLGPERTPPAEVLEDLPVFPLPNVVFLPGMVLPLNVFEPRYLDLVDHVLDHGGHIGIPLLATDCAEEQAAQAAHSGEAPSTKVGGNGQPAFERVFGLGRLVFHRRLPDGRRFIRLEGLGRVRVTEELPQDHKFRRVRGELLPEHEPLDHNAYEVLKAQIERLAATFDDEDREMVSSILRLEDPRIVVYAITALIPNVELLRGHEVSDGNSRCPQLAFQQSCLDAEHTDARVDLLLERSGRLLEQLGAKGKLSRSHMN